MTQQSELQDSHFSSDFVIELNIRGLHACYIPIPIEDISLTHENHYKNHFLNLSNTHKPSSTTIFSFTNTRRVQKICLATATFYLNQQSIKGLIIKQ